MKRFVLLSLMVVVIAAWLMGTAGSASASLVMALDDLATANIIDIIVVDDADGGVGTSTSLGASNTADLLPGDGSIQFVGSLGSFSLNVTTGVSKPFIGNSNNALLDLLSVNVSGGAGTIEIWLTDTDFSVVGQPRPAQLVSSIGGTTMGSVSFEQSVDVGNSEFGTGGPYSINQGPFGSGAFSSTELIGVELAAGPFSLTEKVTVTHSGAGQITSFDALSSVAVPEPATMLLLGAGLVGFCAVGRKKLLNRP